jgi:hypothetical protein
MIKESIADLGLTPYAVFGLLTFFGVYAGIAVWTMTRLYKQVASWSSLPLNDEADLAEVEFDEDPIGEMDNYDSVLCDESRRAESYENNFASIN